jgi:hypothetical protein
MKPWNAAAENGGWRGVYDLGGDDSVNNVNVFLFCLLPYLERRPSVVHFCFSRSFKGTVAVA